MVAQTDNWNLDPWAFVAHPEVWLLVGFLTAAYGYTVRVIGPKAVPAGQPVVTRRNLYAFGAAMALLLDPDHGGLVRKEGQEVAEVDFDRPHTSVEDKEGRLA